MYNVEYIVYRRTTYMLKPYTRNRRIYDYLESSFKGSIVECDILKGILKHSLWEVVLDRDTSAILYGDVPLTDKVRLVARVYFNGATQLEVFSTLGNGINSYNGSLYGYDNCSSSMHKRLIMIDTNMSYEKVHRTIIKANWKHLLFHV